ncbi:hypothetical protein C9374_004108 [Naegleria lovaniensis]|uniref:Aminotransferase class I/classII large domain-containing protein n=1 Tax=Naegleria lovaniensis TaxID=51637 RepID=A0AA88GSB2_NAELO|nr:uncharacterized protein C9374_004108 [Naegleria lovaniensis]KAG2383437.1 hypothetical protein C9374_004108 [Naegleria lovaniensis]
MPMINKIGGIISEVNHSLQQQHNKDSSSDLVYSLCQGMVYFKPPEQALQTLLQHQLMNSCNTLGSEFGFIHNYCEHDFGRRVVREKVKEKLRHINKLEQVDVVLTSGANQGFVSVLLSLCDVGDSCLLFGPYYFNHYMALQMFGVKPVIFDCHECDGYQPGCGHCDDMSRFTEFFENLMKQQENQRNKLKMVVVTTPCNPTGAVYTQYQIDTISQLCAKYGVWMVCDETYEYFIYNDTSVEQQQQPNATSTKTCYHYTPQGDHIIHLYSFSKAFSIPGWRLGYIAYPSSNTELALHLNKIQDTVVISSPVVSQQLAFCILDMEDFGKPWAEEKISTLKHNRKAIWEAIHDLCQLEKMPEGAIYYWATFPNFLNQEHVTMEKEFQVIEWLIRKHKVAVLPGSCFGKPGGFRISYANVSHQVCEIAASRLKSALQELANGQFEKDDLDQYVKTFKNMKF